MPDVELPAVLARRAREIPARAGTCRIVAVDGPSGAGKSTLADAIAAELGAQVVRLDDLIPGWDGLTAGPAITLRDVVRPIAGGNDGGYRRYDWHRGEYAEWRPVPLAEHLVVEGCGAGVRDLAAYVSLLVWVEAERELRFERGIARDGQAFLPHWTKWEKDSQALFAVEQTRQRADVVVDGTDDDWVAGG
ncbi:MAG: AAA family ATPase [Actinomycetota bacterium]|nr:AAA family ATPase [Actinomycetota bacterium]